ncbi:hypothetical protein [Streptomyces sp. NPDC056690]|uniref:hypothetical protein n=1 Tax=unclassified Streptomyces TaxID=2593676 RepID=UPI00363F8F5E
MKLGARPEEYLQSFYGAMDDAINGGDESDRVLTAWGLAVPAGPYTFDLPADVAHGVRNVDGRPVIAPTDVDTVLIDLPDDIESLRRFRTLAPPATGGWPYGTPSAVCSPTEPESPASTIAATTSSNAPPPEHPSMSHPHMKTTISGVELRRIAMPLVAPFRTSFGVETSRDVLLVRSSPPTEPTAGRNARPFPSRGTAPSASTEPRTSCVASSSRPCQRPGGGGRPRTRTFTGYHMAKSVLEVAVLDAQLQLSGESAATSARPATASPAASPSGSWTRSSSSSKPLRTTSSRDTSGSS